MNINKNPDGTFKSAPGVIDWRTIDFWGEYVPYYKIHTRNETVQHFHISEATHKIMCKKYDYKKPWNYIRKCKNGTVNNWYDINLLNFEEFKNYYESHTREETCNFFNISIDNLKEFCKKYNYTKPKDLVEINILKTAELKRAPWLNKMLAINFWDEYVPFFKTHSREDTIKHFNIELYEHKWLLKYYNFAKSKEDIQKLAKRKYYYDNIWFDSLPEVAVYKYYIDHNIKIIHEPTSFNYYFNNKEYKYFPDFLIDNKLIEIKGDHFFKSDGTMCNPFDHSQDALYEAKHQCGLQNGVEFWTNSSYKFAIDYCIITYGIDWTDKISRKKYNEE